MGCNCGKSSKKFKAIIKQAAPIPKPSLPVSAPVIVQPQIPLTWKERRRLRIEYRNKRMAARNAAILASQAAKEAKKNLGNQ